MSSPFYPASVMLFQPHGIMVSHMQVLATPSSTVNTLDPSIKYYAQLRRVWDILAYDCPCPHEAGKALHLLDSKEMG